MRAAQCKRNRRVMSVVGMLIGMTSCRPAHGQMTASEADARIRGMQAMAPGNNQLLLKRVLVADQITLGRMVASEDAILAQDAIEEARRRRAPALGSALAARVKDRRNAALSTMAAAALGEVGGESAKPALRNSLRDDRTPVRAAAALALASTGDHAAIPALREGLGQADRSVCLRSAWELSRLGDRQSIPQIIRLAARLDPAFRQRICDALGHFGTPLAERQLRSMLAHEPYSGTRVHAARALGVPGNRSALPSLVAALKDRSCDVRRAAALALERIGDRSVIPALEQAAQENAPDASNAPTTNRRARAAAHTAALFLAHPTIARTVRGGP